MGSWSGVYAAEMPFRLGAVRSNSLASVRAVLLSEDYVYDLATVSGDPTLADPLVAISRFEELSTMSAALEAHSPLARCDETTLACPVPSPEKIFAIGKNYLDHAEETGHTAPEQPMVFTKFRNALNDPCGEIVLSGDRVDWEVELVVVIGRGGRHIDPTSAWQHVAGLTLGQDISDRRVQRLGSPAQFSLGKSFDGYGPVGPAICSVDLFEDPNDIGLSCAVDGKLRQQGRTRELIFDVPTLIAYLSAICTLTPGDLIFTGTPGGVGDATGTYLSAGSLIESEAEVIGEFHNRCVGPRATR